MPADASARLRGVVASWGRDIGSQPRLLLAAKTAVAAAVSWWLAPFLPLADEQYSYYAPLGALISMSPTIASSARAGVQMLAGLSLGIATGLGGVALDRIGVPAVVALAAVVAVGVLAGGARQLGAGRNWVAIAALFVLLLGGGSAQQFSLSYLIDVAFGVVVGLVVNVVLVPPVYFRRAGRRLSELRDDVAERLHAIADGLADCTPDADELRRRMRRLSATADAVRAEVREADESRRGNPRARRWAAQRDENRSRLRALERTVFFVRDLADVLELAGDRGDAALGDRARDELAEAMHRAADLVATPPEAPESRERLARAEDALDRLWAELDAGPAPSGVAEDVTIALCLRRIVDASRPFVA